MPLTYVLQAVLILPYFYPTIVPQTSAHSLQVVTQEWHSVLQPASEEHDLSQISEHCLQTFSQTAINSFACIEPR